MIMYGGGWCYDRKGKYSNLEIYNEIIDKGVFFTDYSMETSKKVTELLKKPKAGDIIYLKTYPIKEQTLHIQAIGRFMDDKMIDDATIGGQKGNARRVNWVKELSTPISFKIPSARKYNTTFYEENRVEIILKIINCLYGENRIETILEIMNCLNEK